MNFENLTLEINVITLNNKKNINIKKHIIGSPNIQLYPHPFDDKQMFVKKYVSKRDKINSENLKTLDQVIFLLFCFFINQM